MRRKNQKQVFDVGRTLPPKRQAQHRPAGAAPTPTQPIETKPKSRQFKKALVWALLAFMALIVIIGVWDTINLSRAAKKTFGSDNLLSTLSPTGLKNNGAGRVNILLVGYSIDDPGHPGAALTDSIMLLSLNQKAPNGYTLSIPRDLYVKIPGFGYGKINEVYKDGGIGLLEQVVSTDLNTPINYYALIDYSAVRDTVNALGGIWINVQTTDPRGLYDPNINSADGGPLQLSNGWHKLNGQTALNLTRARGDPSPDGRIAYGFARSDFDRTQHQRQVLTAIKNKLNWTLALNPLKNGQVLNAIGTNVKTDIRLQEARPLFSLFNHIPSANLQSLSLNNLGGKNYLNSYSSYYSGSALIPSAGVEDFSEINAALSIYNQ